MTGNGDEVRVRLAGARAHRDLPPFGWLPTAECPAEALAPVCLGEGVSGWLHVDLARANDVVTVVGEQAAQLRLAADLVRQLCSAPEREIAVIIVAEPEEPSWLAGGHRRVAGLGEIATSAATWDRPQLVFCRLPGPSGLTVARRIMVRSRFVIPIVVGASTPSGWSIGVIGGPGGARFVST